VFGATAAAAATGTLGDPAEAEAIVRCCDPFENGTWSCLDGDECCCYTIPGGGGHNECCDSASGQACHDIPGETDHGVQVRGCCYTVCAHECCVTPEEVCTPSGFCLSCGEFGAPCAEECCDVNHVCKDGKECVPKCGEGETLCSNDRCCAADEDCVGGGCMPKCAPGAVRCGDANECCDPGQKCKDKVCVDCIAPETKCGETCCHAGETCCDPDRGICCAAPRTCQDEFLTCVCPDGRCMCGKQCCGAGEHCTINGTCVACPSGSEECGGACCPTGSTCIAADYSGSKGCGGHCECKSGGLLCGNKCCAKNDICVNGVCHPCPSTADACVDHCCDAPFVCAVDHCECPDNSAVCGPTCCAPNEEDCVNGRCLPKCDSDEELNERCGEGCCARPNVCVDGVCQACAPGTTACGPTCCAPGLECYAAGICRCPSGTEPCATGCCPKPVAAKVKAPKSATVEHGTATITVTCTGGCSGTVTIETVAAHTSVLALMSRKPRRVVLGKAKFKVPAGRNSARAHVHLSAGGKRYLAKHHGKLKVQALVKTKGVKSAFLSHAFTLKGRKPKPKR
jgi:hypothetical protein